MSFITKNIYFICRVYYWYPCFEGSCGLRCCIGCPTSFEPTKWAPSSVTACDLIATATFATRGHTTSTSSTPSTFQKASPSWQYNNYRSWWFCIFIQPFTTCQQSFTKIFAKQISCGEFFYATARGLQVMRIQIVQSSLYFARTSKFFSTLKYTILPPNFNQIWSNIVSKWSGISNTVSVPIQTEDTMYSKKYVLSPQITT